MRGRSEIIDLRVEMGNTRPSCMYFSCALHFGLAHLDSMETPTQDRLRRERLDESLRSGEATVVTIILDVTAVTSHFLTLLTRVSVRGGLHLPPVLTGSY
jgi:hypothetical protein